MLQTEEGKRLEEWMIGHVEEWNTICGVGKRPISEEEFMELYDQLMKHGLESITLVLLTCHGYAVYDRVLKQVTSLIREGDEEQARKAEKLMAEYLSS